MNDAIHDVLAEREKTHGNFSQHATITQNLKYWMRQSTGEVQYDELSATHKEALEMIMHKVGRILAGNPHFKDHWTDIAGYAQLVADRCQS